MTPKRDDTARRVSRRPGVPAASLEAWLTSAPPVDVPPLPVPAGAGSLSEQSKMPQTQVFDIPTSTDYAVSVYDRPVTVYAMPTRYGQSLQNGKPVSVYDGKPLHRPMYFACADIGAPASVTVEIRFLPAGELRSVTAHPLSRDIALRREGARVTFDVDRPGTVTLMVNGDHTNCPLHLFFSPPAEAPPEGAIVFGPGYHDLGYDNPITLTDGQTLYLAPGAWVEGVVRAKKARNIRIMGRGILSQRRPEKPDYAGGASAPAGLSLDTCQDVSISGIVVTRGIGGWCSRVVNCDRVDLRDFHVLASVVWSADGFNPCNSRDVTIERSFFRSGDDCIAIKGTTGPGILTHPHEPPAAQPPVENILVRGCVFWSDHNEVLVIGAETRARHIRRIRVSDCDVLVHSAGDGLGVFGIIPLHGTDIRDIVYEDICVEHCEEQLFCFRFVESIWNIPGDHTFPGGIADIVIRNVSVRHQKGGPRSEFTGHAPDKRIENVLIEGLRYGGKAVTDAAGMGLRVNAHVADVRFAPVGDRDSDGTPRKTILVRTVKAVKDPGRNLSPAEDMWAADRPLPDYGSLRPLEQTEHHLIHQGDARYRFLLGVSIVEHKGILYSAWGASAKDENDAQSVFAYKTSRDGKVWSEMKLVASNPDGPDAHSHGVLLSTGGALWAFAPRAHFGDISEYPELRMEVFQFDEQATRWTSKGETAKGFWPLCEPQKMDDGNWIMGGAAPGRWPQCDASVAISQGDDLTHWRVVTIPAKRQTWGETTLLVDGPRVRAFIRPSADGLPLITAISRDFGQTWTMQTDSNLPVSASKPYAGRLSNGAHYLIVNLPVPGLGARDTLAIATSRPGATNFTDMRVIRQGKSPTPRSSGAGISCQWAYPYAIERSGKLYVVYASTKENAELSIVDLNELGRPGTITNAGYSSATASRLTVERAWLYRPEADWFYSHHPHMTFFRDRYYAIWSNGRRDEDAPGQRVLISSSRDFLDWTAPVPLIDTLSGQHGERVLTAAGFHQYDGQLVAYIGSYEYRPECLDGNGNRRPGDKGHTNVTLLAVTSRDGGHWSAPMDLGLPIVPNHGPQPTASGRLILSGNISFPYTDDPYGLRNWRMAGIYPDSMAKAIVDDSEGFWRVQTAASWPHGLCEGSFYQTADGVLHMLLRTNTERLWLSESADDGATWSAPRPTEFSDNATKFHFGRLPDGLFYYVGCPDPDPLWKRSPLVLSLSEDGVHFGRHFVLADDSMTYEQRAAGMHKGGDYGYPHTLVHGGCLHVIVSRRKEAIEVLRGRPIHVGDVR